MKADDFIKCVNEVGVERAEHGSLGIEFHFKDGQIIELYEEGYDNNGLALEVKQEDS